MRSEKTIAFISYHCWRSASRPNINALAEKIGLFSLPVDFETLFWLSDNAHVGGICWFTVFY